jgi:hypothetical protein
MLHRIEWIVGGREPLSAVRSLCGTEVRLSVGVEGRTFSFQGRGKRVKITVPMNALEAKRFKIKTSRVSSGLKKKSEIF